MRLDQLKFDEDLSMCELPARDETQLSQLLNIQYRWRKLADKLKGLYELR